MRGFILPLLCALLLTGCAAAGNGKDMSSAPVATQHAASPENIVQTAASGGTANAFNPYLHDRLPSMRATSSESEGMLKALGGQAQRIEGEASYRKNWKQELYPVVFGNPKAPQEILVLLDFAAPQSEKVWQAVVAAAKTLQPSQCKIVVFAESKENYGTDLMGLGIWIAHSRPGQAMPYLTYALSRWNAVKAAQKGKGRVMRFTHEYDAVTSPEDYPIHYAYLSRLNPPVPAQQEPDVAKYCYDAGNVNLYQAMQIREYYDIRQFPAVVVNGRVLTSISAQSILAALK